MNIKTAFPTSCATDPGDLPGFEMQTHVFLLLDGFTLMAFAGAVETLRLANHVAGRPLYRWEVLSFDGSPVMSSAQILQAVAGAARPLTTRETLVVVGGAHDAAIAPPSRPLLDFLRRSHAHGVRMIALCTATRALAVAGVLRGQTCAVHWEYAEPFAEAFPDLTVSKTAFALGPVPSAAGGTAVTDLYLNLISARQGAAFASRVADALLVQTVRGASERQTAMPPAQLGFRCLALSQALRLMQDALEHPRPMPDIAREIGISVRQIERLFHRHMRVSPNRHYMTIRLEKAKRLLAMTELSIIDVAMATGFGSASHFAKKYRSAFGTSPYQYRTVSQSTPLIARTQFTASRDAGTIQRA